MASFHTSNRFAPLSGALEKEEGAATTTTAEKKHEPAGPSKIKPLEPIKQRTCPRCGKVYGSFNAMRRHFRQKHISLSTTTTNTTASTTTNSTPKYQCQDIESILLTTARALKTSLESSGYDCCTYHLSISYLEVSFENGMLPFESEEGELSNRNVARLRCCAAIGVDLLEEVIHTHRDSDVIIHSAVLLQLTIWSILTSVRAAKRPSHQSDRDTAEESTVVFLKRWLHSPRVQYGKELWYFQVLEQYLSLCQNIAAEDFRMSLERIFSSAVRNTINQLDHVQRLPMCLQLMERGGSLAALAGQDMPYHLENALIQYGQRSVHGILQNEIFQSQMSALFETKWAQAGDTPDKLLHIVFLWEPFVVFCTLYLTGCFDSLSLFQHTSRKLELAQRFFFDLKDKLVNADVTVREVRWLAQNKKRFCEVFRAIAGDDGHALQVLQLREREIQAYTGTAQEVKCVLDCCRAYLQTGDADEACKMFSEGYTMIDDQPLRKLCTNIPEPGTVRPQDYRPYVTLLGVPEQFMEYMVRTDVVRLMSSRVFTHMLKIFCRQQAVTNKDRWWDVLTFVWHSTCQEWDSACQQMLSGDITLQRAQRLFVELEKNDEWVSRCADEVYRMTNDERIAKQRARQLECLLTLETRRRAADILCQLKEQFGFSGTLDDINKFKEQDMTQPLEHLKTSVLDTSQALSDIDERHVEYLRQFGQEENKEFIDWVKITMGRDGVREVKVFVDLALNYVGDSPMDMDKVRNLQAAVTGYAPFIFSASSDSAPFLQRCHEVISNIRADPRLPEKLESTVKLLKWFDGIHKFHGSVEKTALAQVDNIASRGILKIGNVHDEKRRGTDLEFTDVIILEVPDQAGQADGQNETRTYTYGDLVDLQSRLMLVVGHAEQGKENVERFISVMDSVVRLVKTYIQLCRDGCRLFLNWTVKFFFDRSRDVCCIVDFFQRGSRKQKQKLKGSQADHALEDYMEQVASFLDESHKTWLEYVSKKRKEHVQLNLYTMEQLVFLQEQLVLDPFHFSPHLLPLLSLLSPGCTVQHIQEALDKASERETRLNNDGEEEEEDLEVRAAARFISHLEENGFSRKLAAKALEQIHDPEDLEAGLELCMELMQEGESEEDTGAENADPTAQTSAAHEKLQTRRGTIASALQMVDTLWPKGSIQLEAMATKLKDVLTTFLQTVKDSGEDSLSLHHLGLVLQSVAPATDGGFTFVRHLPPTLKPGKPHLLLFPQRDILKAITSLYMSDEDAPLPRPDEALLCTQETTYEQVCMFLHRAFARSSSGKIHCLAFADSLDYEVSEKTEKLMKEYVNTCDHEQYQLVIICTTEDELSAHITAALERYLCSSFLPKKTSVVRTFLAKNFKVANDGTALQSAACVDPERMSVRVVKSTRSGMGKTLFKRRLVAKLRSELEENEEDDEDQEDSTDMDTETESVVADDDEEDFPEDQHSVTIPLYEKAVKIHHVAAILLDCERLVLDTRQPKIIHLDVSYEVQEGLDLLLYSLLVLGCITDHQGRVWLRSSRDLYLIEAMPLLEHTDSQASELYIHQMFTILPNLTCRSPSETLSLRSGNVRKTECGEHDQQFDRGEWSSEVFQRPFQYLSALDRGGEPKPFKDLENMDLGSQRDCLRTLLK